MIHILNGDALATQLSFLNQPKIICRECMIDGPVNNEPKAKFIENRAKFISEYFDVTVEDYHKKVTSEMSKINDIDKNEEILLWFEDDLFCQSNLWFILDFLNQNGISNIFIVRPNHDNWKGFGIMNKNDLKMAIKDKTKLQSYNILHFTKMWRAYQIEDTESMQEIAKNLSCFIARIKEVVQAHIDRKRDNPEEGRPEKRLREIRDSGVSDFGNAFRIFSESEGIYGFGDLQVLKMWEKLV